MRALVVGDIHGCYHTFKFLVEYHWDFKREFLVLVGDVFNKGQHSAETFLYILELQKTYPHQVFLVRGNHEQQILDAIENGHPSSFEKAIFSELKENGISKPELKNYLETLPLKWETQHVLVTHAGISKNVKHPFSVRANSGVLHTRSALKKLKQLQVHGHNPLKRDKPVYNEKSNSWNIDTGAWTGKYLSALRISRKGKVKDIIQEKMHPGDWE